MHTNLIKNKIPSWVKVLKPAEFDDWLEYKITDLSNYKKVIFIGDIQGCSTVLQEYFDKHPYSEKNFYIFTGDYVDRGIENDKVVNFVLEFFETKKNVIFLNGNHDIYLWQWASNQLVATREFNLNTKVQLESAEIDKSRVRNFCKNLRDYVYVKFGNKEILVTHGGLSKIPERFKFLSSKQYISGSGNYNDYKTVDDNFQKTANKNQFSIHGHRNVAKLPVQINDNCFNLEGGVEDGLFLRVIELSNKGFEIVEVKNNIFARESTKIVQVEINNEHKQLVEQLRLSKFIQEKLLPDDISSFNFTRDAFYDKKWNSLTTKARGLFFNIKNYEIVARGYEKFFNIGEMEFTEFENLKKNLVYPLRVYEKENGFLGIMGFNTERNQTIFCSKSSTNNDFSNMFEEIYMSRYKEVLSELRNLMATYNLSFVFEVIEPKKDPHIVEYDLPQIVLLDGIKRQIEFEKMNYEFLQKINTDLNIPIKKLHTQIFDEHDFEKFYTQNISKPITNPDIEGFVIEDSIGFHVKLKLPYYSFWKSVRKFMEQYSQNRNTRISKELQANELFQSFKDFYISNFETLSGKNLVEVRKIFTDKRL
jgi:predicted phosphodiesterase